jgi:hypothetical protein
MLTALLLLGGVGAGGAGNNKVFFASTGPSRDGSSSNNETYRYVFFCILKTIYKIRNKPRMNFVLGETQARITGIEKQLERIERSLKELHKKVFEDLKQQHARYEKMMSGFECIQKAFMMNCEKQQEFNQSLEDLQSYGLGVSDFR